MTGLGFAFRFDPLRILESLSIISLYILFKREKIPFDDCKLKWMAISPCQDASIVTVKTPVYSTFDMLRLLSYTNFQWRYFCFQGKKWNSWSSSSKTNEFAFERKIGRLSTERKAIYLHKLKKGKIKINLLS